MSSPNLMGLVRELKALNAKKKAGEALTEDEKRRRKELKSFLKTALEEQKGGGASMEGTNPHGTVPSMVSEPSLTSEPSGPSAAVEPPRRKPAAGATAPPPAAPPPPARAPAAAPKPAAPKPVASAPAGSPPASSAAPPKPAAKPAAKPAPAPTPAPTPAATPKPAAPAPVAAAPAPSPVPMRRNAFAIDAGALLDEAAGSSAVAATHQVEKGPGATRAAGSTLRFDGGFDTAKALEGFTGNRASPADIADAVAKADQAARANKNRPRAKAHEEVAVQLSEIVAESGFTDPASDDLYILEDYYGTYNEEGYDFLDDDRAADLPPVDPREIELYKVGLGASSTGGIEAGEISLAVPAGLAFLDDFVQLYETRVLPSPQDEEEPDLDDPDLLIPGRRKVTVHMLNGASRRGVVRQMRKGDLGFTLEPLGAGRSEEISMTQIKALFIQRPSRSEPIPAQGHMLTVTFRDRRKVQGASIDYAPGVAVFTLIPTTGQFERIIVNSGAVTLVQ